MAQLVKPPTSAQVTISQFVNLSPTSGSVLTAQNLEPASDSVSPSFPSPPLLPLSLSLSKINKHLKNVNKVKSMDFAAKRDLDMPSIFIKESMEQRPPVRESLGVFFLNIFFNFFKCLLNFKRYIERDRAWAGERQRERETQNRKQVPGSELSAQSPTRGSNS